MESGYGSLQSAAIQRRNEELERILSTAPGVGGNLSVIREGTHEGPTHSAGNTELTPIPFVPGCKIQSYNLDHSVSGSQLSAEVGWTIDSVDVVSVAEATSHSAQRLRNHETLHGQKVELVEGGSKRITSLPPRTPKSVSLQTLAIQQKNLELEKQILTLEMEALQIGENLSSHSLGLQQRNDEIERRLAALNLQANRPVVRVTLSSATQALNHRNQELERQLSETNAAEKERANKISLRACELEKMMSKAQELDLVFLVDATDSMQFYIDMVKHRVVDIANGIRRVHAQLALRVAFVPYRDYAERVYDDNDVCDFTSSFEGEGSTFIKALTRVRTGGGGDDAEDVFSGLERVTSLSWKAATTRVLVHIADAPCHGLQFHNGSVGDRYPAGDYWGRNIDSLLKYLQNDCQIASYLFCHINDSTRKMIHEFKRYTTQPGCRPWIEEEQLLSDVDNLVQIVVKNACRTISHVTMSINVPH